jgi:hypothetical protein
MPQLQEESYLSMGRFGLPTLKSPLARQSHAKGELQPGLDFFTRKFPFDFGTEPPALMGSQLPV